MKDRLHQDPCEVPEEVQDTIHQDGTQTPPPQATRPHQLADHRVRLANTAETKPMITYHEKKTDNVQLSERYAENQTTRKLIIDTFPPCNIGPARWSATTTKRTTKKGIKVAMRVTQKAKIKASTIRTKTETTKSRAL